MGDDNWMITLKQALAALQGRNEFVTKETKDTICFDYVVIKDDTFDDPEFGWIRRNFRGITFCKYTGELISLPFPKFFNLNQTQDSQFVDHKHKKATIYEKVDGSMIHFYKNYYGKLVASTCRSSENTQSQESLQFVSNDASLLDNINASINNGFTPIFEWCAPHNQIVVHYSQPRLVYLMSRSKIDGSYLFENKYADRVSVYNIDFCEILNNTDRTHFEGYVCHLEDGNIFKVKTPWYMERHKSVDLLTRPKYKAYELSLNGYMDDIIALSPDGHKEIFINIDREVKDDIIEYHSSLNEEFDLLSKQHTQAGVIDRKGFALAAKDNLNFPALMQMVSGKNPVVYIKKKLLEKYERLYRNKIMQ